MNTQAQRFEITTSRQFEAWLAESRASLAFSTYQAGMVMLIGTNADGRLSLFNRQLDRAMGLTISGGTLYAASLYQLHRFENLLPAGATTGEGFDQVLAPRFSYVTGDLDIHDIGVEADGGAIFVNSLFSCLARPSMTHSFKPVWKPAFISRLAAEDRCHLNGLAMEDGTARYVTAISATDTADGWRDNRRDGGVVIDVASGETVAAGFSMPHSPRLHQGRLWLHDSGTGRFGTVDIASGRFDEVAFCPGYLRGLTFVGDYAVMGLSLPRDSKTFSGLALDEALAARKVEPRAAIYVVDLRTGDVAHWARLHGIVTELYDVAALRGVRKPMMVGFKSDEIRRLISVDDAEQLDKRVTLQ
ncbi:TIGR03032 family protein [Stappia sp. F7233]|uniref:TIGR03032 family protein n=1 Tax=Stappia albiluteola TaxID=2758565 RepID=A0A839AHM6_9HYPH|nr:TIGR03032 family protein [Stappia albiluteola]MBA5778247.1 TIGR03032 family protein [Stappia albiluteola]